VRSIAAKGNATVVTFDADVSRVPCRSPRAKILFGRVGPGDMGQGTMTYQITCRSHVNLRSSANTPTPTISSSFPRSLLPLVPLGLTDEAGYSLQYYPLKPKLRFCLGAYCVSCNTMGLKTLDAKAWRGETPCALLHWCTGTQTH
jgi:hypothetical protein